MSLFDLAATKLHLNRSVINDENMYLIGDVANLLSVEPSAIRYYEKVGLVRPQRSGRFRFYKGVDVRRLATILFLRKCGLSISGIQNFLAHSEGAREVANRVGDGPKQIERQLMDLIATHREMIDSIGAVLRVLDHGADTALASNQTVELASDGEGQLQHCA